MDEHKHHSTTQPYLDAIRKHKKPYKTKVLGRDIVIYPNVMSPKYDWYPEFYVRNMPNQKDKEFLEIGCGCGIVSLFAGLQGAKRIVAIDINKNAIENTKENLKRYKIKDFEVFYSNVFKNVEGKFDTIAFAAPFYSHKAKNILERGISDPDYNALKTFMRNSKHYLKRRGNIILGFSTLGDLGLLKRLIKENKFTVNKINKQKKEGWTGYLYVLASS